MLRRPLLGIVEARESVAWHVYAAVVVVAAATLFLGTAYGRTGGIWPAPLDDTYIYFGCARSIALGSPFAWFPGNGYGSGCTSTLYPFLLAPLWLVGLRGATLGLGASLLSVLCLFDLSRSLRRLVSSHPVSWLFPMLVVAIPLASWSWFAGMETALLGALLGRSLLAAHRTLHAEDRARPQWQLGGWLLLLALTRVEVVPFVAACAVAMAYYGGRLSALGSLARVGGPSSAALLVQALTNRLLTGEWAQAGGVRKALWSSPYLNDSDVAFAWLKNLLILIDQAIVRSLGGGWLALALPLLLVAGVVLRRHRAMVLALLAGSVGALVLVCLNSTAPFQNYRYAVPSIAMGMAGAALGMHALAAASRPMQWLGGALAVVGILAPAPQLRGQVRHFAQASVNIVDQHHAVATRLAALRPAPTTILVNDAGVIPYLTEIAPIDAFGLGGYHGMPFARASVHGQPAVVELIERLPPERRPDVMALYPAWWGDIVARFGTPIATVRIDNNVICGQDQKVIYAADWSLLSSAPPIGIDGLDVADLISEREHAYRFPHPGTGWVVGEVRNDTSGAPRFDGGRIIAAGRPTSFRLGVEVRAPVTMEIRTDDKTGSLRIHVRRDGVVVEEAFAVAGQSRPGGWRHLSARLSNVIAGDRVELQHEHDFRLYQVWLHAL